MKRYPTYLTVGEMEFLMGTLENLEPQRGIHERAAIRKLRDHITRSVERAVVDDVLHEGREL